MRKLITFCALVFCVTGGYAVDESPNRIYLYEDPRLNTELDNVYYRANINLHNSQYGYSALLGPITMSSSCYIAGTLYVGGTVTIGTATITSLDITEDMLVGRDLFVTRYSTFSNFVNFDTDVRMTDGHNFNTGDSSKINLGANSNIEFTDNSGIIQWNSTSDSMQISGNQPDTISILDADSSNLLAIDSGKTDGTRGVYSYADLYMQGYSILDIASCYVNNVLDIKFGGTIELGANTAINFSDTDTAGIFFTPGDGIKFRHDTVTDTLLVSSDSVQTYVDLLVDNADITVTGDGAATGVITAPNVVADQLTLDLANDDKLWSYDLGPYNVIECEVDDTTGLRISSWSIAVNQIDALYNDLGFRGVLFSTHVYVTGDLTMGPSSAFTVGGRLTFEDGNYIESDAGGYGGYRFYGGNSYMDSSLNTQLGITAITGNISANSGYVYATSSGIFDGGLDVGGNGVIDGTLNLGNDIYFESVISGYNAHNNLRLEGAIYASGGVYSVDELKVADNTGDNYFTVVASSINAYPYTIFKDTVTINGNLIVLGTTTLTTPAAVDHGGLAGLDGDDHPHYLLADGARDLTGDWNIGTYEIISSSKITAAILKAVGLIYSNGGVCTDNFFMSSTKGLYFDGGVDTYLVESSNNVLDIYAGGDKSLTVGKDAVTLGGSLEMGSYSINSSSNITAAYFYGDGSNLTGIAAGALPPDVTFDDLVVTGTVKLPDLGQDWNITSYEIISTSDITAAYFHGDGSNLTGISASALPADVTFDDLTATGTVNGGAGYFDSITLNGDLTAGEAVGSIYFGEISTARYNLLYSTITATEGLHIYNDSSDADVMYFPLNTAVKDVTLYDNLTFDSASQSLILIQNGKLFFDGDYTNNTYITSDASDQLSFVCNNSEIMDLQTTAINLRQPVAVTGGLTATGSISAPEITISTINATAGRSSIYVSSAIVGGYGVSRGDMNAIPCAGFNSGGLELRLATTPYIDFSTVTSASMDYGARLYYNAAPGTLSLYGANAACGHLSIEGTKKLYLDGGGDTYIHEKSANNLAFVAGGVEKLVVSDTAVSAPEITISTINATSGQWAIAMTSSVWVKTGTTGEIQINPTGGVEVVNYTSGGYIDFSSTTRLNAAISYDGRIQYQQNTDTINFYHRAAGPIGGWKSDGLFVDATDKFYLDGGGDTYITEASGNTIDMYAGGVKQFSQTATGVTIATMTVSNTATIAQHMKRIYYTTLTSSATSVDITVNQKNYYRVIADFVNPLNSQTVYCIRYNNRADVSDYYQVNDYYYASAKVESITNNTRFAVGFSTSSSVEFSHVQAIVDIIPGRAAVSGESSSNRGYPSFFASWVVTAYASANVYGGGSFYGMCTDNDARDEVLTTLTILANVTNGLGIGTYIEVWEEQ